MGIDQETGQQMVGLQAANGRKGFRLAYLSDLIAL